MPLVIVFVALLGGVVGHFDFRGRLFSFSWIDGVAVAALLLGAWMAWRRRRIRIDLALVAYGGILGTVALQVALLEGVWDMVGGATRFAVPAVLVLGLSQVVPDGAVTAERPVWRWPMVLGGFGSVLGIWVVMQLVRGFLDPTRDDLYEIKNAVVVPMGASNYLAAFLLVALVASATFALRDRRYLVPAALSGAGLLATLSRGALLALLVVLVGAAIVRRARRTLAVLAGLMLAAGIVVAVLSPLDRGDGEPWAPLEPPVLRPVPADATDADARDIDGGGNAEEAPEVYTGLPGAIVGDVPGRVHLFRSAWRAFLERPVLGVGLNRVAETNAIDGVGHPHVHNVLLNSLVAVGLLGTIGYVALYWLLFQRIRRVREPAERTALTLAVVAFVLHAQVEAIAYTRAAEVLLAVLLLIAAARSGVGVRDVALGTGSPGQPADRRSDEEADDGVSGSLLEWAPGARAAQRRAAGSPGTHVRGG